MIAADGDTLEYPEGESLRTHLDAAQGMILQLLL